MINQKWLTTFVALAQIRHFGKTAIALHMTQPGVSQHLAKLEQQLGVELMDREAKPLELTAAGKKLHRYGLRMQQQQQLLLSQLQQDEAGVGECRIALSGALAYFCYPDWLAYQRQHPKLMLALEAAPNSRIEQQLLSVDIDVGVMSRESHNVKLEQTKLAPEPLALIIPKATKLQPTLEHLQSLGFIDHPDGAYYLEQVLQANFEIGTEDIPVKGYVNQMGQILEPVAQGIGFTVLPVSALRHFHQAQLIAVLELPNKVVEPRYLTRRKGQSLPKRYAWFVDYLSRLTSSRLSPPT
ncbi:LysR family transcriptional regulator [Paraferrimonas haliotis]|uniref:LysR family transcriptional regulator n=1 Tax=Paraferrimonas haliotis TaxID=2013866 RepID=UPI000BA9456D|nr:LysR family transcriptional regulator [Paraferrimonas haliotis]